MYQSILVIIQEQNEVQFLLKLHDTSSSDRNFIYFILLK